MSHPVLSFPLLRGSDRPLRIPAPVPSRPTVLLVDDDADMRLLLRFHLEREGLEVLGVADRAEALDFIAERPDCGHRDAPRCSNRRVAGALWALALTAAVSVSAR